MGLPFIGKQIGGDGLSKYSLTDKLKMEQAVKQAAFIDITNLVGNSVKREGTESVFVHVLII